MSRLLSPTTVNVFAPLMVPLAGWEREGAWEELITFADLGDSLRVAPSPHGILRASGAYAGDAEPCWRALEAGLSDAGARLSLEIVKDTPPVGEGEALLAAAMRALARLTGQSLTAPDTKIAACLSSRAALVTRAFVRALRMPKLPVVLIETGAEPAPPARRAAPQTPPADWSSPAEFASWLPKEDSGAQEAVEELCLAPDCLHARRTTDGMLAVGIFPDLRTAEGAARYLSERHPLWWVRATILS